jgi:uncharacterized membrane protein
MDKHIRTFWKSVTWRIVATTTTFTLVYIATGDFLIGASIGIFEALIKSVIYYIHERLWNKITFGRVTILTNKTSKITIKTRKNTATQQNSKNK